MSQLLALFDLDGTLVDSAPDISLALDSALTDSSLPVLGEHKVRSYIGEGSKRLVHRAITRKYEGVADKNLYDKVSKKFLDKRGYDFDLYIDAIDPETQLPPAVTAFEVTGIPAKFVIDPEGIIRFELEGFEGDMEAAAEELTQMVEIARKGF